MTKKKILNDGYSKLQQAQYNLRFIANELESGRNLSECLHKFLVDCLWRIGKGEDANAVFQVKPARGERRSNRNKIQPFKVSMALAWIATAIAPSEDGGLGLTLDDAIAQIASVSDETTGSTKTAPWGRYTEETLRYHWTHNPEMQRQEFPQPIELLPNRRPK